MKFEQSGCFQYALIKEEVNKFYTLDPDEYMDEDDPNYDHDTYRDGYTVLMTGQEIISQKPHTEYVATTEY